MTACMCVVAARASMHAMRSHSPAQSTRTTLASVRIPCARIHAPDTPSFSSRASGTARRIAWSAESCGSWSPTARTTAELSPPPPPPAAAALGVHENGKGKTE
eukprot:TRINITY_DN17890_c0_g1::TRINITY_DN17890_c0_g1_i1::g.11807::m.11807 TRINITY_DN17890_c0_g1::TRINITY_DN17890_c0_g1_i1::g.11807  ORF type:complete len:103 (+),score=5.39,DUF1070/PF06376.7/0.41 TRINITY_DN17890_c0_g1_i1:58-366(+)